MFRKVRLPFLFMLLILLIACKGGKMSEKIVSPDPIKNVPESAWKRLSEKKIYFGHQSVGFNIIEGLEQIKKENPRIKLTIVKINNAAELSGPMLAHSTLGENTDTHSKMQAFADYLEKGIGTRADIAFFKFCYVDITAYSDVEKVFTEYKNMMEQLRKKYPRIRFIHATVPLTVSKTTIRTMIKKALLGKEDNNIKRNRFNEMLWKEYAGKEPLFDIARAEYTYPDGTQRSFTNGGTPYYSLVPDYTDDGGHLNEKGKRAVAQELLLFLANL